MSPYLKRLEHILDILGYQIQKLDPSVTRWQEVAQALHRDGKTYPRNTSNVYGEAWEGLSWSPGHVAAMHDIFNDDLFVKCHDCCPYLSTKNESFRELHVFRFLWHRLEPAHGQISRGIHSLKDCPYGNGSSCTRQYFIKNKILC